jgi:hypothetical protein
VDLKTLSIHAIASQTPLYKRHSSQAGISESENEKHEATGNIYINIYI